MGWTAWTQPAVLAQVTGTSVSNPSALAPLALRRWFASLTLSSPESVPSLFGLWVWLGGLLGLMVLAALFQGPVRTLSQVFDAAGNARLAADATRRLRRAGRMVAAVVGLTVLSWTGSQSLAYDTPENRDDLILLTRARALGELAFEQGVLAALTPLRDVAGLAANLPLLALATLILFRTSADTWGGSLPPPGMPRRKPLSAWATVGWVCGALLVLYRLMSMGSKSTELPLGGCLMVEAAVIPAVMAVCDGMLLGWVLVELRKSAGGGFDDEALDTSAAVALMPATVLACVAALPARYLATSVLLGSYYLPTSAAATPIGGWLRWQLGWGLSVVQGVALLFAGLAGAVTWGRGGLLSSLRVYARMLKAEGGRVVVVLALAGLAAGVLGAVAYLAVLSLPAASWVLNAADSYAHYASLPAGLWALSALIELAERSLPTASLAPAEPVIAVTRAETSRRP